MAEFYSDLCPTYFRDQKADLYWYRRTWASMLRRLEGMTDGRDLLDFGSGPGFLVELARERGWNAIGYETSGLAREMASAAGRPTTLCLFPEAYDAVISTEVLEHIEDTQEALAQAMSALRPGGLFMASVPNDYNPLQKLLNRGETPWVTPLHVHYFNRHTLRAALERAGMEVVWEGATFPVEVLLALPIKRKLAWKLSRLWNSPPLLWRARIGRHCLIVGRKPK